MRTLLTVAILCSSCFFSYGAVENYVKRFIGEWVGDYTITDLQTNESTTYRMEQINYWLEDQLVQISAIKTSSEATSYEESTVQVDGKFLISEAVNDSGAKTYIGWLHAQKIWWSTPLTESGKELLIYTESLQPGANGFCLETEGYFWRSSDSELKPLYLKASLRRLKKDEALELF